MIWEYAKLISNLSAGTTKEMLASSGYVLKLKKIIIIKYDYDEINLKNVFNNFKK